MPMLPVMKARLEEDISDAFKRVVVGVKEHDYNVDITVDPLFIKEKQYIEDPTKYEKESRPVIIFSYPGEDMQSPKIYMNDILREEEIPAVDFARADETVNSFETATGSSSVSTTFTVTEPGLYSINVYIDLPTDSTSWMKITLYDQNGDKILSKVEYNESVPTGGWYEVLTEYFVSDLTETFTVTVSEFTSVTTDNPLGINVGKNVAGEVLVRSYSYILHSIRGKVNDCVLQVDVIGKNKEKHQDPNKGTFVGRTDMADQILQQIRLRVLENWPIQFTGIGLNNVGQTNVLNEFADTTFFVDAQLTISLRYEEIYAIPMKIMKEVNVGMVRL